VKITPSIVELIKFHNFILILLGFDPFQNQTNAFKIIILITLIMLEAKPLDSSFLEDMIGAKIKICPTISCCSSNKTPKHGYTNRFLSKNKNSFNHFKLFGYQQLLNFKQKTGNQANLHISSVLKGINI